MRINWIEGRWFDKRYSIQRAYVRGLIKIHASMCPEVLWLVNAVWESVSTSTGCWLWLIGRTSPAANLSYSALTSSNRDTLKGKWRKKNVLSSHTLSTCLLSLLLWIKHPCEYFMRSSCSCFCIAVSLCAVYLWPAPRMSKLAELLKLNIPFAICKIFNVQYPSTSLWICCCAFFANVWIDFLVDCFPPGSVQMDLLLWSNWSTSPDSCSLLVSPRVFKALPILYCLFKSPLARLCFRSLSFFLIVSHCLWCVLSSWRWDPSSIFCMSPLDFFFHMGFIYQYLQRAWNFWFSNYLFAKVWPK